MELERIFYFFYFRYRYSTNGPKRSIQNGKDSPETIEIRHQPGHASRTGRFRHSHGQFQQPQKAGGHEGSEVGSKPRHSKMQRISCRHGNEASQSQGTSDESVAVTSAT